ncbi:hypothetical protein L916_08214 [Phytophthora nicotianae]|uniref:Uncharacterized protein n=1 Tax=Phytophthora nicotianae TaxID=4792 RepID=W2J4L1_PHYNI|nr:hypothetical protein L916_08214 [Phytophthora nicotianae]
MGTKEFWKFDPATEEVELRPIPGKMLLLCLDGYNKSNDASMGCTMMVIWVVGGFL